VKIDYSLIDKELKRTGILINILMKKAGKKSFAFQYKFRRFQTRPPKGIDSSNLWIDRKNGTKMRLRIYKPLSRTKKGPAILWIHGGGYATGTPELNARLCKRLVDESDAFIVAPDYRLSVEETYPAALDDCYSALLWLKDHAEEFGANNEQLMVGGESAGGGLTAAITLLARDRKEVNIAFQMPLYPMIDDRMTSNSARDNDAPGWNAHNNREAWKLYLGDLFGTDDVPYYAAPARVLDYSGLPPAVTYIGDLDPFLDETISYFQSLKQAGIPAEYKIYNGCYHGFDVACPNAGISRRATDEFITSFRYAVKTYYNKQP
jgi:acetyl esterase/lipase